MVYTKRKNSTFSMFCQIFFNLYDLSIYNRFRYYMLLLPVGHKNKSQSFTILNIFYYIIIFVYIKILCRNMVKNAVSLKFIKQSPIILAIVIYEVRNSVMTVSFREVAKVVPMYYIIIFIITPFCKTNLRI